MRTAGFIAAMATSLGLIGAVGVYDTASTGAITLQPIDRIIGDGEFNTIYPIPDAPQHVQRQQIRQRLEKIVALLGSRDVSAMPAALQQERARNLRHLLAYRERGEFPVNYERAGEFLPCFIDSAGAICAVGYLVEKSAGRDVAEAINAEYKYATVEQMSSPVLDNWIARSGLSRAEIETIQEPAMEPYRTIDERGDTVIAWRRTEMARPGVPSWMIKSPGDQKIDSAVAPARSTNPQPAISQARRKR